MLLTRSTVRLYNSSFRLPVHHKLFPAYIVRQQVPQIRYYITTPKMSTNQQLDDLISFWFDRDPQDWFKPPPGLDDEIRNRYLELIKEARTGGLNHWATEPKGALGLVLLLDQFPRNIFRGSGESFSSDKQAAQLATQAIAKGFDVKLGQTSKLQMTVMYIPLMHAEDLLSQVACKALYQAAASSCEKGSKIAATLEQNVAFAQRHLDCIAKLGRFPKRNEVLGRHSTDEEKIYLQENPAGF